MRAHRLVGFALVFALGPAAACADLDAADGGKGDHLDEDRLQTLTVTPDGLLTRKTLTCPEPGCLLRISRARGDLSSLVVVEHGEVWTEDVTPDDTSETGRIEWLAPVRAGPVLLDFNEGRHEAPDYQPEPYSVELFASACDVAATIPGDRQIARELGAGQEAVALASERDWHAWKATVTDELTFGGDYTPTFVGNFPTMVIMDVFDACADGRPDPTPSCYRGGDEIDCGSIALLGEEEIEVVPACGDTTEELYAVLTSAPDQHSCEPYDLRLDNASY